MLEIFSVCMHAFPREKVKGVPNNSLDEVLKLMENSGTLLHVVGIASVISNHYKKVPWKNKMHS